MSSDQRGLITQDSIKQYVKDRFEKKYEDIEGYENNKTTVEIHKLLFTCIYPKLYTAHGREVERAITNAIATEGGGQATVALNKDSDDDDSDDEEDEEEDNNDEIDGEAEKLVSSSPKEKGQAMKNKTKQRG